MSSDPKIRSYAITFRPRDGVTDSHIKVFTQYVEKHCDYYYVITEKLGAERHIHAGIFLKNAVTKSNLGKSLKAAIKGLSTEEYLVFRKGIKKMYNHDFMDNYMNKGDDTCVILKCLPEAATLDSYFSEVSPPAKMGPKAVDSYFSNLEALWFTHKRVEEECNPENLRHFLMKMMNVTRVIRIVSDNRKVFAISCALARYINKEDTWNVEADCFHQDK